MTTPYIPKRAMFIYAHPDDIEFSSGATSALWAAGGCETSYVLVTNGNVGSHEAGVTMEQLAETRQAEQRAAGKICGVQHFHFLGYPDGLVEPTLALRKQLVRLIRQFKPNVVVCGDPGLNFFNENFVNHPDHRAVSKSALDAVFPAAEMNMLYPDFAAEGLMGHKVNYLYITSPVSDPNVAIDISDYIDTKLKALQAHVSQFGEDWDPSEMIREWAAERGKAFDLPYAEVYYRVTLKADEETTT